MVFEIQHEKLGAKLHTDTSSYVKTCTRTRPCKSIHLCRGTFFLQWRRLTVLRISQTNVLRHGFVCQKLHTEKDLQINVVWLYIVSGTSMGNYIQTRPPMW